jgi:hypothetical protein
MSQQRSCPDCNDAPHELSRRDFIKTTSAAGVVAASTLAGGNMARAAEKETKKASSETLVTQLYKSLKDEQKKGCAFSFDDPLRHEVNNNWFITKARVGKSFDKDQQDLIRQIFLGLHSEEYAQKVLKQVEHDNASRGGFGDCAIALFGEPGSGKFEFVFTGRHVTRRCDGDSVEGAAFGGPIFYGHAADGFNEPPDHPGNVYWYQAKRANELFQALEGKQRDTALRTDPRPERKTKTVELSGKASGLKGLPYSELSTDQKELAEKVMDDVLAPFRKQDRDECMKLVRASGMDDLHFSYFKNMDVGDDGVWDVWQIEGPNMLWYFRGDPHVHTWVNIRASA